MKRLTVWMALLLSVLVMAQEPTPIPKELDWAKFMVGNWTSELTFTFGGAEGTGKGTISSKMGVGGRYLQSEHTYAPPGMGQMAGLQLLTYDANAKKWKTWWFDSMESGTMEFTGDLVGDTLTLTSKPTPMHGSDQAMVMRVVYKKTSATTIDFRLEMQQGTQFVPLISGIYKKS